MKINDKLKKHLIDHFGSIDNVPDSLYTLISKLNKDYEDLAGIDQVELLNEELQTEVLIRKNAERALAEQEQFLRAIIDFNPQLIFVKDWDGKFLLVNKSVADVYDTTPEAMVGLTNHDFNKSPYELKQYLEQDRRVIELKQPVMVPEDQLTNIRTGETKLYQTIKVPIQLEAMDKGIILGVSTDISELVRVRKELELRAVELADSNEELERFAYIASHDLQEPLRMIASYVQLLVAKLDPHMDKDAKQYTKFTIDGVSRLQNLIQDLLQYSRINKAEYNFKDVDFNEVLEIVKQNLGNKIKDKNVAIIAEDLPTVKADKLQMMQLVQNLVDNAIKFSTEGNPEVRISYSSDTYYHLFSIKDNGIGIEEKFLDKIFVIFQRLHTRDKFQGTGIGLAICKKIVDRHKGSIHVDSDPGEGTTFTFSIARDLN